MLPDNSLSSIAVPADFLSPDDIAGNDLLDFELGGVHIKDSSKGLQYQIWTLELQGNNVVVSSPNTNATTLFSKEKITQIGLAWDQNMNPFVAYVADGQGWYWWYDTVSLTQIHTKLPGDCRNLRCCLDDKRHLQTGASDIILAYIKNNGLYFRAQRDRYNVEYLLKDRVEGKLLRIGMNTVNRVQFIIADTKRVVIDPPKLVLTGNLSDILTVGQAVDLQYIATGGTPPYAYNISSGTVPTGTTMDSAGHLTGVASTAGVFVWRVQATDASRRTIALIDGATTYAPEPLQIVSSPNFGRVGVAYNSTYGAMGGVPPYAYSIISGALPPGLTFGVDSITGTPTAAGEYHYTVRVTDFTGAHADRADTIIVFAEFQALYLRGLDGVTLPDAPDTVMDRQYSYGYAAGGGDPPYSYSYSGTLPPGITFSVVEDQYSHQNVAMLTGAANALGTYNFTVTCNDTTSHIASVSDTIGVTIPSITVTADYPDVAVATKTLINVTPVVSGATPPLTWEKESGTIPPGLTLVTYNGAIFGYATEAGVYNFTLKVTDADHYTAQLAGTLTIRTQLSMLYTTAFPDGKVGEVYNHGYGVSPFTTGGMAPYTYVISSGTLPPGLSIDASTGVILGTPTVSGYYVFKIKVTDSDPIASVDTPQSFELQRSMGVVN